MTDRIPLADAGHRPLGSVLLAGAVGVPLPFHRRRQPGGEVKEVADDARVRASNAAQSPVPHVPALFCALLPY